MLRFWLSNWINYAPVVFLLTFTVTAFSTVKIFQMVRRHQRQIVDQNAAGLRTNAVNILKCRKSAVTVLYFYALLLIFSPPFCVTTVVETFMGCNRAVKIAYIYVATAVFINSCLNPLVYCWRIREIRQAVRNLLNIKN